MRKLLIPSLLGFLTVAGSLAVAQPPKPKAGATKPAAPLKNDALLDKAMNRYDFTPRVAATVVYYLPGRTSAVTGEAEGVTIEAKVTNSAKGFMEKSRFAFSAPPDTMPPARIGQGEWVLLDDGAQLHTLYPRRKQFVTTGRKSERFSSLFRPTVERIRARGVTFKSSETTQGGRPVYLLQGRSVDGFTAQVILERSSLNIQSIVVASPTGRVVNQFTFRDQKFLPDFAPETFQRPADYQPYVPDAG